MCIKTVSRKQKSPKANKVCFIYHIFCYFQDHDKEPDTISIPLFYFLNIKKEHEVQFIISDFLVFKRKT